MNSIAERQDIILNSGDLNEMVLEASAKNIGDVVAPEATAETSDITAWDQSSGVTGRRMPEMPAQNEKTISEKLVDAGNDEADREQRVAAVLDEQAE